MKEDKHLVVIVEWSVTFSTLGTMSINPLGLFLLIHLMCDEVVSSLVECTSLVIFF